MHNQLQKTGATTSVTDNQQKEVPFFNKGSEGSFFTKTQNASTPASENPNQPGDPHILEDLTRSAFQKMMEKEAMKKEILGSVLLAVAQDYWTSFQTQTPIKPVFDNSENITPKTLGTISVNKIYDAIYPYASPIKISNKKGGIDWSFKWPDGIPFGEKTFEQKFKDAAVWGANEGFDTIIKCAIKSKPEIVQTGIKVALEFILDRGPISAFFYSIGASEAIFTAITVYGFLEIFDMFDDNVSEEERIVNDVRAFLYAKDNAKKEEMQKRKDKEDIEKNFWKAEPIKSDRLAPTDKKRLPSNVVDGLILGKNFDPGFPKK